MKFKSAEADWNTSFVSQHMEGRNWKDAVARKWYRRSGCGEQVMVSRSPGGVEDVDEGLLEVCRRFLDESASDDGSNGCGTEQTKGEAAKEKL